MQLVTQPIGTLIDGARRLAFAEHATHKHGEMPYSYHLVAVVGIVSCFTRDEEIIAAAWLHDIVEDCPDIDLDIIQTMFGPRVCDLVDRLTDQPGPRALAKPLSLAKISQSPEATLIKLADRYHNHASTIIDKSEKYAKMYLAEYESFIAAFHQYRFGNYDTLINNLENQIPYLVEIVELGKLK